MRFLVPIAAWVCGCTLVVCAVGFTERSVSGQLPAELSFVDRHWRGVWYVLGMYDSLGEAKVEKDESCATCDDLDAFFYASEIGTYSSARLEEMTGTLAKVHSAAIDLSVSLLPLIFALLLYDYLTNSHLAIRCPSCERRIRELKEGCCGHCGSVLFLSANSTYLRNGNRRRRICGLLVSVALLFCWLLIVDTNTGFFVSPDWLDGAPHFSSVDLAIRSLWESLGLYEGCRVPACENLGFSPVRVIRAFNFQV